MQPRAGEECTKIMTLQPCFGSPGAEFLRSGAKLGSGIENLTSKFVGSSFAKIFLRFSQNFSEILNFCGRFRIRLY